MSSLPVQGRIQCTKCYKHSITEFNHTQRTEDDWRITANPMAWGSPEPEIVVLGFSKGPTQIAAIPQTPHNDIAYKSSRLNVGKILAHIGLLAKSEPASLTKNVDSIIADQQGRFHFGSLIRCTVERYDQKSKTWKGSGGGMLDKFITTPFGASIANTCSAQYLGDLPRSVKVVVMFGMGTNNNYVEAALKLFKSARPGAWKRINKVAYTDGHITVVHVEHFASQGALIPNWLGERNHDRSQLGEMAKEAIESVR